MAREQVEIGTPRIGAGPLPLGAPTRHWGALLELSLSGLGDRGGRAGARDKAREVGTPCQMDKKHCAVADLFIYMSAHVLQISVRMIFPSPPHSLNLLRHRLPSGCKKAQRSLALSQACSSAAGGGKEFHWTSLSQNVAVLGSAHLLGPLVCNAHCRR